MNHQKLFTALGLGLLLLIASVSQTLADSPQPQTDQSLQSARSCATFASAEQKIDTIVQFAHTPLQDSKEIRTCYDTLSADQKVQIFYRVAEKRGLGAKIAEEINKAKSLQILPLAYGTVLTPWTAIGTGQWRTAYTYWIDNGSRCPTGRGTEYNFAYSFSTNVTNPSALRANSPWNILVDSAIIYYTINFGGLLTWYDTNSTVITTCVGDTALSTVGGPNVWRSSAVIYKP
jgi:hypothetical protein